MSAALAALILRLLGWRTVLTPPPGPKTVVIFYPHTSNWDFPFGVLFRAKHRLPVRWAGKDSMFRGPLRPFFLALGGIPVNRRERTGMVAQLADQFARHEVFNLCIAPEGTRKKTEHWKSGFYRLALAANVPVGLAFIDYAKKEVGIGDWLTLSGDEAADLARCRAFYADKTAYAPDKAGDIRFPERGAD